MNKSDKCVKWGAATRVVPNRRALLSELSGRLIDFDRAPQRNDVAVAEVLEVNHHSRLEVDSGRHRTLFEGDIVGVAFGYRYATNQYEGIVPGLCPEYHLLSVGGVCGEVVGKPADMDPPTRIRPIGYLSDGQGHTLNLRAYAATPTKISPYLPVTTIVVVGTSMDSGKTTAAASIVRGLTLSGRRVCAGKLTGTASLKDIWLMRDAGAIRTMDFTWVGQATTAMCEEGELIQIYRTIWSKLAVLRPDFIVLEIADGVLQRETSMLLKWLSNSLLSVRIVCAIGDPLAVGPIAEYLNGLHLDLIGFSGKITKTPLGQREVANATFYPVWSSEELSGPMIGEFLLPRPQEQAV